NGCVEFLRQALTVLAAEHKVALVRADAGFFEKRFLAFLERRGFSVIIVGEVSSLVRGRGVAFISPHRRRARRAGGKGGHRGDRGSQRGEKLSQLAGKKPPFGVSAPRDLRASPSTRKTAF